MMIFLTLAALVGAASLSPVCWRIPRVDQQDYCYADIGMRLFSYYYDNLYVFIAEYLYLNTNKYGSLFRKHCTNKNSTNSKNILISVINLFICNIFDIQKKYSNSFTSSL